VGATAGPLPEQSFRAYTARMTNVVLLMLSLLCPTPRKSKYHFESPTGPNTL